MKTAIATLLSAVAVTTVSNGAGAETFNVVLNTNTYLGEMNAIIVNDAIAPIYTPVTTRKDTSKSDDGNNAIPMRPELSGSPQCWQRLTPPSRP